MEIFLIGGLVVAGLAGTIGIVTYAYAPVPNVEKLKARGDIGGLAKALTYRKRRLESELVRENAALALGELRALAAVNMLIYTVNNPAEALRVRQAAMIALARIKDAKAVPTLIGAYSDPALNPIAIEALKKFGPIVGQSLNSAMRHPNESIRSAAIDMLGDLGEVWALPMLINALKDKSSANRKKARRIIGQFRKRAAPSLVKALQMAQDDEFRLTLIELLGDYGTSSAHEGLLDYLVSCNRELRQQSAQALTALNWEPLTEVEQAQFKIAHEDWEGCVTLGATAITPMLNIINRCYDKEVEQNAIDAILKIGAAAIEPVSPLAISQNKREQAHAITILSALNNPEATTVLVQGLSQAKGEARLALVHALDRLNWEPGENESAAYYWISKENKHQCLALGLTAVNPLSNVLKSADEPDNQRRLAAEILERIDVGNSGNDLIRYWIRNRRWEKCVLAGADAVIPLVETLTTETSVQAEIIETLGRIGEPRAVESILLVLKEKDWILIDHALVAMVRIGPPAVPHLINVVEDTDRYKPHVRRVAIDALGEIKDNRAHPVLTKLAFDRNAEADVKIRKASINALGSVGGYQSVPTLISVVEDSYEAWEIREAAINALGNLGNAQVVGVLLTLLNNWQELGSLREASARALGEIGSKETVENLISVLRAEKSAAIAEAIVETLAQITGQNWGKDADNWDKWWRKQNQK